jgi:glycolate oxidase FAD binding subunit
MGTGSTADVRDQVRDAIARRRSLRIVGRGSWLDANRPVHAESSLVVQGLSGIVEYEPGDLTLTARAGTTLAEIAEATAAHGQWLALDPPGDPEVATLGATIATGSYGPLAHHFGTPRDQTLGVEIVTGYGDVVRGGGRVVKNVAGFDLTRLVTGSWGSLGVITEATVRLRALPSVQATIAVDVPGTPREVERVRAALRALPFVPLAATLLDRRSSDVIGAGREVLLVRLGGNEEAVRAQRDELRALGDIGEVDGRVWHRLRGLEPARAAVLRLSHLPSLVARTWVDAARLVDKWGGGYFAADLGRGVVRVVLPLASETKESDLVAILDVPFDGTRIYERLPGDLWTTLAPSAVRDALSRGIKAAFDPHNVLNPGILGELE